MNSPEQKSIRPVVPHDIPALKRIVDATDMFPSELLDDMIAGYFRNGSNEEIWLTYNDDGAKAVAFCRPEEMTDRTWNLLLIAVDPERQGEGIGTALMQYIEDHLAGLSQRVLIVETSGTEALANTREFYRKCQYDEESRIRDFYADGDDKITFWKSFRT